ncbi:right-handed parallel beta-helix repeat-containing protein [Burkholderia territorii]|uniref:right-handed parallel beta-helix repeat-containing protein n=1 Tax=Burkholderia territorii TaxID=1503055 RepID=UPI000A85D603|nr:right-handed parallel beta-helix repeat-containing protein [Burkholderia territorii]
MKRRKLDHVDLGRAARMLCGGLIALSSLMLSGCGGDDVTAPSVTDSGATIGTTKPGAGANEPGGTLGPTTPTAPTAPAVPAVPAAKVSLYVSPSGKGDCTAGAPCTLNQAQLKVRSMLSSGSTDVQVLLADGTYRLSSTWQFGAADSGTPGHPVIWKAAPGAHPIISGATQISYWTQSGPSGTWSASVPAGSNSRQLYINGAHTLVAQQTPDQLGFNGRWTTTPTGYNISKDPVAMAWFAKLSAEQVANVEFDYPGGNDNWTDSRCRVASYSNGTLTMTQPCWTNVAFRAYTTALVPKLTGALPPLKSARIIPSSIQNTLSLIQPGQWFLDTVGQRLYYMPIQGQRMEDLDVELPQLEALVQGAGSLSNPLHDVTFSGLQFSYATWNDPSTSVGFADVQSNLRLTTNDGKQGLCDFVTPRGSCPWAALTQPLANVSFTGSNNITFSENRFINLGGAGLAFKYGSSNNLIQNNEFTSISSTAIMMGCTYDPTPIPVDGHDATNPALIKENCNPNKALVENDVIGTNEIMQNNKIVGNLIHHIGTDYRSACGITLLFGQKTTITQNEIHDVPYTAITAGVIQGHVDDSEHPNESVNINDSNVISNNLLHDYMQALSDGGAIYIEGHQAQYQYKSDGTIDPDATLAHGMQTIGNVTYNGNNTNYNFYDDAGSEWISWQGNVSVNGDGNVHVDSPSADVYKVNGQGGCAATGHIWVTGNYLSSLWSQYDCKPAIDWHENGNTTINSLSDVPTSVINHAGRNGVAGAISENAFYGRLGDNSSQITYSGSWHRRFSFYDVGFDYLRDLHYTAADNDTMRIQFNGTAIQIFGEQSVDQGKLGISIDGGVQQIVNTVPADGQRHSNVAVYTSPLLARGPHSLTVTKLSGQYATMNGAYIFP